MKTQMCGASDNRAAQMSLTLTLSRHRERELRREREFKKKDWELDSTV